MIKIDKWAKTILLKLRNTNDKCVTCEKVGMIWWMTKKYLGWRTFFCGGLWHSITFYAIKQLHTDKHNILSDFSDSTCITEVILTSNTCFYFGEISINCEGTYKISIPEPEHSVNILGTF